MFPMLVYSLCFATGAMCAFLLGRSYLRSRSRLLLWSAFCFGLLAGVNFVVIIDMEVLPDIDFRPLRLWITLVAVSLLLFGFIWNEDT